MLNLSYRFKLLLFVVGIVVVLEAVSYTSARTVIRDAVTEQAREDLRRGGDLFSQLMNNRARLLALAVGVMVEDFGLREAVAIGHPATIESALQNHMARIRADLAVVLDGEGKVIAGSALIPNADSELFSTLIDKNGYALILVEGRLYQFMLAPIFAPEYVGTAGVGFEIDQSLSVYLKHLTNLEVSFVHVMPESLLYLNGTLSEQEQISLLASRDMAINTAGTIWQTEHMLGNTVQLSAEPHKIVASLQIPISSAMQPFSVLDTQLFALTISFVFFATLLSLLVARSVTKPIQVLADAARDMADGLYGRRVVVHSNDEFGELADAFNTMQHAIAEREKKIVYQLQHDSLTGLENRSQVLPQLSRLLSVAQSSNASLAVLAVDVNKFTQINDTFSSAAGDEVLRQVGTRFQQILPTQSVVIRMGSDEFLLLISLGAENEMLSVQEQLQRNFDESFLIEGAPMRIDLNIGYCIYPQAGDSPELLLRRANLALKHAQQTDVFIAEYQQGWDEAHLKNLRILGEFNSALEAGQLAVYYQPKVGAKDKAKVCAEALIRWIHPELGFINPETLIQLLENAGQVGALTRWVLSRALTNMVELREQGIDIEVSVNLSALDLLEDDLPDYVASLLQEHNIAAAKLCLEVTESALMRDAEHSLANLHRFNRLGCALSVDDYGTGYSSLSQLKQLPVSELKIDKSFVLQLDQNKDDQFIVQSTIELGHSLGLSVTAEGVESEASGAILRSYGCDTLQGYFYSKPAPLPEFSLWVKNYLANVHSWSANE